MKVRVKIPKLGLTTEEVTLSVWERETGDAVAMGDVVATIEADKANYEITAPVAGILRQLAEPGAMLPVGADVAIIES